MAAMCCKINRHVRGVTDNLKIMVVPVSRLSLEYSAIGLNRDLNLKLTTGKFPEKQTKVLI